MPRCDLISLLLVHAPFDRDAAEQCEERFIVGLMHQSRSLVMMKPRYHKVQSMRTLGDRALNRGPASRSRLKQVEAGTATAATLFVVACPGPKWMSITPRPSRLHCTVGSY